MRVALMDSQRMHIINPHPFVHAQSIEEEANETT